MIDALYKCFDSDDKKKLMFSLNLEVYLWKLNEDDEVSSRSSKHLRTNLALSKKRDLLVGYHILDAIDTLEKLISEYRLNGKYALNSILQLEMTVGTEKVN